jgi:hypothetical protein
MTLSNQEVKNLLQSVFDDGTIRKEGKNNMNNLIYKKMSDVMKDVGAIGKDQKNTQQGFKFRGIDQFVNALYPALTKHGVFMSPRATSFTHELKDVVRGSGKSGVDKHVSIMMEYDFYAEDGSKVTVGPVPAEGLDSGDKATNKALSAALKYALIQTFSIPTEDMAEADFDSPEIGVTAATTATTETTMATVKAAPTSAVEPMKKSSFRKPKAPVTSANAPETIGAEEWS